MNFLTKGFHKQRLLVMLLVLGVANLLVWGKIVVGDFPVGSLYATGTAFATDGTVLNFSDRIEFKEEHYSFGIKVHWNDNINFMQETGIATHGWLGELDINLESGSNFGPPLLAEVELDDELSFDRSYMQGGHAKLSLLPFSGGFDQLCYYYIYLKKTYCGSDEQRSPSGLQ